MRGGSVATFDVSITRPLECTSVMPQPTNRLWSTCLWIVFRKALNMHLEILRMNVNRFKKVVDTQQLTGEFQMKFFFLMDLKSEGVG